MLTKFYFITVIVLLPAVWAWTSLAPLVPTDKKDLKRVNKAADLKPGSVFIEFGCGNGRVCRYIARNNPETKVIGIELNIYSYFFTKLKQILFGPKNLEIRFGDAMKYDISDSDVLYTFALIQTVNGMIKKKIMKEMKPGARLVSYAFAMEEWDGETFHDEVEGSTSIYVYQKK